MPTDEPKDEAKKAKGKPKKKNAAKKTYEDWVLEDARNTLAHVKAHWADFEADQKPRKVKALELDFCKTFKTQIEEAQAAVSDSTTARSGIGTATTAEETLREELRDALTDIRSEIGEAYGEDLTIQKAFGRGQSFPIGSTPSLARIARDFQAHFEDPKWTTMAKDAGVGAARIKDLVQLAEKLEAADVTQKRAQGDSAFSTLDKAGKIKFISKMAALARKVAKRIFRSKPAIAKLFKPLAGLKRSSNK